MIFGLFQDEDSELTSWLKSASPQQVIDMALACLKSQDRRHEVLTLVKHLQSLMKNQSDPIYVKSVVYESLLSAQVNPNACITALEQSISMAEPVLGKNAAEVIECYRALAFCCATTKGTFGGGKQKARKAAKTALERQREVLGDDHPATLDTADLLQRCESGIGLGYYSIKI